MTLFVLLTYLLIVAISIIRILRQVRNPSKTLIWIGVVITIPVIGLIMFYLIGKNPNKDNFFQISRPFSNYQKKDLNSDLIPSSKLRLAQLLQHNESAALSFNNKIRILRNGEETFQFIFESLRNAEHTIHMDFYILESENMLEECLEICSEKIAEGVKVRLIYDGFGTYELKKSIRNKFKEIGIDSREFFPFHLFSIFKFINYRNHRKIVIVDNKIAFTGGMNI